MDLVTQTQRREGYRLFQEWVFPGGHKVVLYTSEGHRATVSVRDSVDDIILYREYEWHEVDRARRDASALVQLGYSVAVAVFGGVAGEMVA
jgi:hypothetical protein